MSINIQNFFEVPNEQQWLNTALKSLKLEDLSQLERYTKKLSIDDVEYHAFSGDSEKEIYLNTFPTKRILGREILVGQPHQESTDHGVEYVFATTPLGIQENQKLIQVVKDSKAKFFGDEVLLDAFSLLKQLDYSHQDLVKYFEKEIKSSNVHLLINGSSLHNAGASIITEVSHDLFLALKYSSLFFENERKVCFKVPIDSHYFAQIAKLRALRYMFETILEKEEVDANNFLIMTTSSLREMSLYDPWVNMLRTTSSVTSSFLGGADVIIPRSFDVLNQIYNMESSSTLALRQSRNVFHILNEESHLSFVNDPSRGAAAIEDLTEQVIQKSFVKLKELNSYKSMQFMYEKLAEEVSEKSDKRYEEIRSRHKIICGINDFANRDEKINSHFQLQALEPDPSDLFPLRRLPSEFEILRLKCEEIIEKNNKQMLLLYFGDQKKINARIGFCVNYFELLGIEVEVQDIQNYMSFDPHKYLGLIYCANDDDYTEMLELTESFPETSLFIAGKKVDKPGFTNIFMGQDTFQVLNDFLEKVAQK